MFPTQPKKWPQALLAVAVALFVFKNPETAAELLKQVADALSRFVDAF